jgi:hypothetical protein
MNNLQLKRRVSGNAGAPSSLLSGELAWNMVDGLLYGGQGDDGGGNATSIVALAGAGFVANIPAGGTALQVLRKNAANDGYEWGTVSGGGSYTAGSGLNLSGNEFSVDFSAVASLASPAFTGNPTVPTQASGNNSTRAASTAFVQSAIADVIGAAPAALDTLAELATALQDNDSDIAGINTALSVRLITTNNLSDLTDASAARANLGLGSLALQDASNVNITGGTLSNVAIDCGTF